ncbi:MAG TPA: hypothetical protein VJA26_00015 [Gammaproteobacteria bacterium]|nr:hypothetical protein [Gammaproteobacteria bacterium]
MAAAERATTLDPESSEALEAQANFQYWQYRFRGDFAAFVQAQKNFRRAIDLDPSNSLAFFDYGRALMWYEPDLAKSLFERALEIDPLARGAHNLTATILSLQGEPEAARERCREWEARTVADRELCTIVLAIVELTYGNLDRSITLLRRVKRGENVGLETQLWSAYLSLGDEVAARRALVFGDSELAKVLATAAGHTMDGHYDAAHSALERQRSRFQFSRVLDLPTARMALIAGRPAQALAILKTRLPDLATGTEPVNARNVMPALDLAAAWSTTGEAALAGQMLARVAAFLDGPSAPRLPLFEFMRARMHALAGKPELALQALDRAYQAGFRTTWAVDINPQPLLYIDPIEADPCLASLHSDPRFKRWLARIADDNARQLERLRAHDAAQAST